MTFCFAWLERPMVLDHTAHLRQDLQILDFAITHNEGEAALLKMKVYAYKATPLTHGILSYVPPKGDAIVLFMGALCHFPLRLKKHVWQLEFRAHVDAKSFVRAQASLKSQLNPYFLKQKDAPVPADYLESSPQLFQFDRISGACVVSDIFYGRENITPRHVFDDSVKVTFAELPLSHIDLELSASWTQEDRGEVDIALSIAKAFSCGLMNTFTPKTFMAQFPKVGTKLGERRGRSGCRVVESEIQEVLPPPTGLLNLYPRTSPPLWHRKQGENDPISTTLKQTYFQTKLVVEWHYRQARQEIVRVRIRNAMPSPAFRPGKVLRFELNHLPTLEGSFFKSMPGLPALRHAIARAKAHLAMSARCIEVTFRIPLQEGLFLHLDQSVTLKDILHLKRDVFAKVIGYELNRKGTVGFCEVRCALSFGMVAADEDLIAYGADLPSSYVGGVDALHDEVWGKLRSKGILTTKPLHTLDLVEAVVVQDGPEEQILKLTGADDLESVLKHSPTRVSIQLKDLRTQPLLKEEVMLDDQTYAPPPLISLSELEDS